MISIIIPTLDEERYIGRILDALQKQTFSEFEAIVVDGCSDDGTREIAEKYGFVRVINSSVRNVSYQRNLGAKEAKFERLLFLDADSHIGEDFLEKALKKIERKKLAIAGCYLYPDSKSIFYKTAYFMFRKWIWFVSKVKSPELNGTCLFSTKKLHDKIGGFDHEITFAEDYDYSSKASRFCKPELLNPVKIYTSVRRFETEGRILAGLKYLLMGGYITLFGNPKQGIFEYKFGHYK